MLYKVILFLLISSQMEAMEVNECAVRIDIDGTEVLLRKVSAILKDNDPATQLIIENLLTQEHPKKSSLEQRQQKEFIIRKITDSDD